MKMKKFTKKFLHDEMRSNKQRAELVATLHFSFLDSTNFFGGNFISFFTTFLTEMAEMQNLIAS
jgi:hypothetical protein